MHLLVTLTPELESADSLALEEAVLAGPPRDMFRQDLDAEEWIRIRDRGIWLRLARLDQTSAALTEDGSQRLRDLSVGYPSWQLREGDRDDFPVWMGAGEDWREHVPTPRRRPELVEWLKEHPVADDWQEDDWRQRCREDFPTTACALYALTTEAVWPADRWRVALQVWAEESLIRRSWRRMGTTVIQMPDDPFGELAPQVSWWLQAIADTFEGQEENFVTLSERLLALDYEDPTQADGTPNAALNRPVGQVTDGLLRWGYRRPLEDGQRLPERLRSIFTRLCDTRAAKFRPARTMLAARVIALFRLDPDWTAQHLLPLFDWRKAELEARSVWQGFLWSPRLYRPLIEALKPVFLDTANHYSDLDGFGEMYVSLLTFAALDSRDVFTKTELSSATRALPQEGLEQTAEALVRSLEGTSEQRAHYWANRVEPYLHSTWPKSTSIASASIAQSFGHLCIRAGDAFPQALTRLQPWLRRLEAPNHLLHLLHEAGLCVQFPEPALEFLHLVVDHTAGRLPADLRACLDGIRSAAPEATEGSRYVRLNTYLGQHGQSD